jgi:hypothetical protein
LGYLALDRVAEDPPHLLRRDGLHFGAVTPALFLEPLVPGVLLLRRERLDAVGLEALRVDAQAAPGGFALGEMLQSLQDVALKVATAGAVVAEVVDRD